MSECSNSSSVPGIAGTSKGVDKQQLTELQKRVRMELGRIKQQVRLKHSDEVKVCLVILAVTAVDVMTDGTRYRKVVKSFLLQKLSLVRLKPDIHHHVSHRNATFHKDFYAGKLMMRKKVCFALFR